MAANYTALISAWNGATQPPTGVTGTGLSGGDTTAQKLAKVQAWTVSGSVPTSFYVTGNQLINCINWTEFAALTTAQQNNLLALCQVSGDLLGGSGNTSFLVDGMFLTYFTNLSGPTITALTALAQATVQPFWQYVGLNGPISMTDVTLAGLS
jgi:hypothetical protein